MLTNTTTTEEDNTDTNKQKLINMAEISLVLDSYDDIFSDFDPRSYSERALSDDFLSETKRASRDKAKGTIELNFLIPENMRKVKYEQLIKKRLKDHFKKHHQLILEENRKLIKRGVIFIMAGVVVMFLASYITTRYTDKNLFISFMTILLEPAGWFFFWEGLRQVIFETKTKKAELDFYDKMAKCDINFFSH